MKKFLSCFLAAAAALTFTACSGSSSDGESASSGGTGGLAPAAIEQNTTLTPATTTIQGIIAMQSGPAHTVTFSIAGDTTNIYVGDYTYTKTGPNTAHLQLDNVREEAIHSASDCLWSMNLYLTYVSETKVIIHGTETLVGSLVEAGVNDPLGFTGANSHFEDINHTNGGTRNIPHLEYAISH